MYVDTHCHVSKEEIDFYLADAVREDVKIIVLQSVDLKNSLDNVSITGMYDEVYACIGHHPEDVESFKDEDIEVYRELLKNDKVVGIGEIGLDYHYTKENRDLQISVFRKFLSLASEFNKPVVIHSRNASEDTLNILKEYNVKGIIHCFSGSKELAYEYIKLGFYIGIGGVVTFENSKLAETIKSIPLSKIVLETDAPYLTPHPFRGRKNGSKFIPVISVKVATTYMTTLDDVMETTTKNALNVYNIKE